MKTKLPRSYDAGITEAGKSLGFAAAITPRQARSVFSRRPDIAHIETPAGYYLRDVTPRKAAKA